MQKEVQLIRPFIATVDIVEEEEVTAACPAVFFWQVKP
jgi:hypothetical protein